MTSPKPAVTEAKEVKLNDKQQKDVKAVVMGASISGDLIELESEENLVKQIGDKIAGVAEALLTQVEDGHDFYFLSFGFHSPEKSFMGIEVKGNADDIIMTNLVRGELKNTNVNFTPQVIKRYIVELADSEIEKTLQKITDEKERASLRASWEKSKQQILAKIAGEKTKQFESEKIREESGVNPVFEAAKTRALREAGLRLDTAEVKGSGKSRSITYYLLSPELKESKEGYRPAELKVLSPRDIREGESFLRNELQKKYPLARKLNELWRNKIFNFTLVETDKGFNAEFTFPGSVGSSSEKLRFTIEIPSGKDVMTLIQSTLDSLQVQKQADAALLKIAKSFTPALKESSFTAGMKVLLMDRHFYQFFKSNKQNLSLTDFGAVSFLEANVLLKESSTIVRLLDIGFIKPAQLKNLNENVLSLLSIQKLCDAIEIYRIPLDALKLLNKADVAMLVGGRAEADLPLYLMALVAIRMGESEPKPKDPGALFYESKAETFKDLSDLDLSHRILKNLIRTDMVNMDVLRSVQSQSRLKRMIADVDRIPEKDKDKSFGRIQDRSSLMYYLYIKGLLPIDQIRPIPFVNEEQLKILPVHSFEEWEAKFAAINAEGGLDAIIKNFLQLAKAKLLDEADLNLMVNDAVFRAALKEEPKEKLSATLAHYCLESVNRRIDTGLAEFLFRNPSEEPAKVTERFFAGFTDAFGQQKFDDGAALVKSRLLILPLISVLYDLSLEEKAAAADVWGDSDTASKKSSAWGDDEADETQNVDWGDRDTEASSGWGEAADSAMEEEKQEDALQVSYDVRAINFANFAKFIAKLDSIKSADNLKAEIKQVFVPEKAEAKAGKSTLTKWHDALQSLADKDTVAKLSGLAKTLKGSDATAARRLEQFAHAVENVADLAAGRGHKKRRSGGF